MFAENIEGRNLDVCLRPSLFFSLSIDISLQNCKKNSFYIKTIPEWYSNLTEKIGNAKSLESFKSQNMTEENKITNAHAPPVLIIPITGVSHKICI